MKKWFWLRLSLFIIFLIAVCISVYKNLDEIKAQISPIELHHHDNIINKAIENIPSIEYQDERIIENNITSNDEDRSDIPFENTITSYFYSDWKEIWDYSKENAKILEQIKHSSFWDKKIDEDIDNNGFWYCKTTWEIKILWYWLLCDSYEENLKNCEYSIAFSCKVDKWGYTSYQVHWKGGSSSRRWFSYHLAVNQIAMNDIWNWKVFYDVHTRNDDEIKEKYISEEFKNSYTWDYRFIDVAQLVTNNEDWSSNYHLYIITDEWETIYKNTTKIISKETARNIIANDASIKPETIRFLYLHPEEWKYTCNFSLKWHTYDYEIDSSNWNILKRNDDIDIWETEAIRIALDDAWIKDKDLREDTWDEMQFYLMPHIEKKWNWKKAVYEVKINTKQDKTYSYKISAYDWSIINKKVN